MATPNPISTGGAKGTSSQANRRTNLALSKNSNNSNTNPLNRGQYQAGPNDSEQKKAANLSLARNRDSRNEPMSDELLRRAGRYGGAAAGGAAATYLTGGTGAAVGEKIGGFVGEKVVQTKIFKWLLWTFVIAAIFFALFIPLAITISLCGSWTLYWASWVNSGADSLRDFCQQLNI